MPLRRAIAGALGRPTADDVWVLRAELLEAGVPPDSELWTVLRHFHGYLVRLASSTTSRQYSELASRLDIAAVGGIALERLLEEQAPRDLALSLLAGFVSEGLMILATRQHVKAWEGELESVFREVAWYLYGALWRWAEEVNPELPAGERRRLIDRALEPLRDSATAGEVKAVVAGRLFQVLLVGWLRDVTRVQRS